MTWTVLLTLLLIHSAQSFSPMRLSGQVGMGDSHRDITDKAIKKIAYEYVEVTTEEKFVEKLQQGYKKHFTAVDLIKKSNAKVDEDPHTENRPSYHFDAEMFVKSNNLLITSQEVIVNSIRNSQYSAARELLGRYLHTHQDFYSHSNWIEMGERGAYRLLGEIGAFEGKVATINMSTCLNCRDPWLAPYYECIDNINPTINQQKLFTSGYYGGQTEDGEPVPKPTNVFKCSHGGVRDTTRDIPAVGGINKDVDWNRYSPHYYYQKQAADAAIESTYLFLKKLWDLTETKNDKTAHFGRLLDLVSCYRSLIFVIDISGSMDDDIAAVKMRVREIIDSASSDTTKLPCEIIVVAFEATAFSIVSKPEIEGDLERLLNFLDRLTISGGIEYVMNAITHGLTLSNDQCLVYVFTDEPGDDRQRGDEVLTLAKRKNCNINFLLSGNVNKRFMDSPKVEAEGRAYVTFEQIAMQTGGIKVDVTKDDIFNITQVISQMINTYPVPILLVNPVVSTSNLHTFSIDSSIETLRFLIHIKLEFWAPTNEDVRNLFVPPGQSSFDFLLTFDTKNVKIGQINKPAVGQWQFRASPSLVSSFEITLITPIQFEHSFNTFNNESAHPGLQTIDSDPIKGENLYSLISIIQTTAERILLDEIDFVDSSNNHLQKYKLTEEGDLSYSSEIEIPLTEFYIKIIGKNNNNEIIERLYPHKIVPRTLELYVIVDSHSSTYIKPGDEAKINFSLINHNSYAMNIDVSVVQSLPLFTITLDKSRFTLKANETLPGDFKLKASNSLTLIDHTSEISIIAKSLSVSDAFNSVVLRATIISPFSDLEPPNCTYLFPSGKKPIDVCQGEMNSCSSRHWDIFVNITDGYNKSIVFPSNVRLGLHSVVLTYYDSKDIFQSNKETIKFIVNQTNQFDLQMLLAPNDCCKKYAEIVAYDQNGNKAICMEFQRLANSTPSQAKKILWNLLVVLMVISRQKY